MEKVNLTILTGAGISAESGIKTFRDSNGLWENHSVTEVASPQGFKDNPQLVHDFYNARRAQATTVQPNAAHYALADLEKFWLDNDLGGFLLITQNIDDLHEQAGSKNIAHIHGELNKQRCENCFEISTINGNMSPLDVCPECRTRGSLRPQIVWFGEMPFYLDKIEFVLDNTDLYYAMGTSGAVMPASLFGSAVKMNGRETETIEMNLEPSDNDGFDHRINGKATLTVPLAVEELKERFG